MIQQHDFYKMFSVYMPPSHKPSRHKLSQTEALHIKPWTMDISPPDVSPLGHNFLNVCPGLNTLGQNPPDIRPQYRSPIGQNLPDICPSDQCPQGQKAPFIAERMTSNMPCVRKF